jgi:hypothetical protein
MAAQAIQGSFIGGGPRLPSPMGQPTAPPRLSGPPVPAFAPRLPAAQPCGPGDAFSVDPGRLGLANGGGRPLPDAVRGRMEGALRADFSNVRVHVGPQAERIGAIAFTIGSDIYFAPGRFEPDTACGRQLLGHELAHVVQQRQGRVRNPMGSGVAVVRDRVLEAEADRLGQRAAAYRFEVQAKMARGAAQPSAPVRISPPISAVPGRHRLLPGAGGRRVGSVMVRTAYNHLRPGGRPVCRPWSASLAMQPEGATGRANVEPASHALHALSPPSRTVQRHGPGLQQKQFALAKTAHLGKHLKEWKAYFPEVDSVKRVQEIAEELFYQTQQHE